MPEFRIPKTKDDLQELIGQYERDRMDEIGGGFEYRTHGPRKMPANLNEKINALIDKYFADSPFTLLEVYKTNIHVLNKSTYEFNITAYARDDKGQIRPGVLSGYVNVSRPNYTRLSNAHWYNEGELDEYTGHLTNVYYKNHPQKKT